jgi:lysophospholipase L1-like esterase
VRAVVAGLLLVLTACQAVDVVAPTGPIAAWGDSMTFGYGVSPADAYPTVLASTLGRPVYNGGVSGQTSSEILARIVADTLRQGDVAVLWLGTNNWGDTATVVRDIAQAVQHVGPRYLILTVMNRPGEPAGTPDYTMLMAMNAGLATRYPGHVVDIRAVFVAHYDPSSPQDVADHAADVPASSLRGDAVHPNVAGYHLIAATVADAIRARGW